MILAISGPAGAHGISHNEIANLDLDSEPRVRMAQAWCGDFNGPPSARPGELNIVIANPAGAADHNERLAQLISRAVEESNSHLVLASEQQKAFRFARNSACPGNPLEIKALNLSNSVEQLQAMSGLRAGSLINNEINQAYGRAGRGSADKQLVVVNSYSPEGIAGYGFIDSGQAITFVKDPLRYDSSSMAYVVSHEVMHILGAVDPKAPHGAPGYHCWQEHDLMCYDDGTLPRPIITECPSPSGSLPPLDCGNDDYFAPNPAPGSFLANNPKSNVYNSIYLLDCVRDSQSCRQAQQPKISELEAGVKDDGSVLLSGRITSPAGVNYYFDWGQRGASRFLAASGRMVSQDIEGLHPGKQYRWRLTASNDFGQVVSDEQVFTVPEKTLQISKLRVNRRSKSKIFFSWRASGEGEVIISLGKTEKKKMVVAGLNRSSLKLPARPKRAQIKLRGAAGYQLGGPRLSLSLVKRR